DFDGVIANSEPLHFRAFRDVLAAEGLTLSERDYYDRYLGFDDVGVFRALGIDEHRISDFAKQKAIRIEALERDVSILFPGAAAAVRRLAAAVPLAIASGAIGVEIRRGAGGGEPRPVFSPRPGGGGDARTKTPPPPPP